MRALSSARVGWLASVSCCGAALALTVSARSAAPASSSPEHPPVIAAGPAVAVAGDPLALDRLARYKIGAPSPTKTSRSPFTFGAASSAGLPRPAGRRPRVAVIPDANVVVPIQSPPSLIGIVSGHLGDNGQRTAVFTAADGTTEFGRIDEVIGAGRYRVRAVEAASVTVVDTITGELSCMPLR